MWGKNHIWNQVNSLLVQQQSSVQSGPSWLSWRRECLRDPVSLFKKGPHGFSTVQPCGGHTGFSWQDPRQVLGSCQEEENASWTAGDRSWCGRPHPSQLSFPTLCHWFPGRVTLVTLSFNLLQRAWPVEHFSRGWEQTLGYSSPDGNYHFSPRCLFQGKPQHSDTSGSGACSAFTKTESQGENIKAELPGKEQKWANCKRK